MKKYTILILIFLMNISIVNAFENVSDTLLEKQSREYSIGGKGYKVTLNFVDADEAQFVINGQTTRKMKDGDTDKLSDGTSVRVTDISYQDYNGGIRNATFTLTEVSEVFCGDGKCTSGEICLKDGCCNGKKIDFASDNKNCGSCDNICHIGYGCDNGKCVLTAVFIDLSNYPNFLFKNDQIELTLVVADKSSSSNVLAQANIASSLSSLGIKANLKNKLSSEVTDLNQNIISLGNPCINDITAKIMNNPQPCDKDFQKGKGYIKLYKNNDFYHLIVAGNSDVGTRKTAEILVNYEDYQFQGNEYIVDVAEPTKEVKIEEKKEENATKIETTEKETVVKTEVQPLELLNKTKVKEEQEKPKEIKIESKESKQIIKEETNIIKKVIVWFLSLFR